MRIEYPDPKCPDMSPEGIERRLHVLEALRKLGLSLKDAGERGSVSESATQEVAGSITGSGSTFRPEQSTGV